MQYNKNFGSLTNNILAFAPISFDTEDGTVFTNDAIIYAAHGYKPVVRVDMPAAVEGYYWVSSWVESDTAITQTWTQEAVPTPTDDPNKVIDVLTGESE